MYLGSIVELGTTEEIFQPPYHPYTEALLSAVPIVNRHVSKREIILEGSLPSALNPPKGCAFESRCPRRLTDICEHEPPPVKKISAQHSIACHIDVEVLKKVEPVISLSVVESKSSLMPNIARSD